MNVIIGRTQISRFLAFLGDWALAYLLYNLSRGLGPFEGSYGRWKGVLESLGLGTYEFALGAIVFFVLLRFYSFLLLATTPFYFLLGLHCPRSWWFKRLTLPLKAVADGFLLPLALVTSWTLWWTPKSKEKKRHRGESSFIERHLGVTFIQRPEGGLQSAASFIVFPLFVISLYAPLLSHLTWLDGATITEEELELSSVESFANLRLLTSTRFGLQIMTDFKEGEIQLWPDFQYVREGTQLRLVPLIRIFHLKRKTLLELRPLDEINWNQILDSSIALMGPWKKSTRDLLSSRPLQGEACDLHQKMVRDSFKLGRAQLFAHTLRFGPFLRGHLRLREELLGLVDGLPETEVDILIINNRPLLRMRQRRPAPGRGDERVVHTYVPICERPARPLEISFPGSAAHALAYQDFLDYVLSGTNWDEPLDVRLPAREDDFQVFHFSDFLTQLDSDSLQDYEAGSMRYLTDLVDHLSPDHRPYFLLSYKRLMEVTELVHRRDGLEFSRDYRSRLNEILKTLEEVP